MQQRAQQTGSSSKFILYFWLPFQALVRSALSISTDDSVHRQLSLEMEGTCFPFRCADMQDATGRIGAERSPNVDPWCERE